jgi:cell division GTPase FtsZ
MTIQVSRGKLDEEIIVDNITNEENKPIENKIIEQPALDEEKLAKLRAKLAAKTKEIEMTTNHSTAAKKEKSINFGIVGSGQAGSRIAETFYKLGYDAVVINTAQQDLKFIDIPESNKLLLEHGLGGAAKDMSIGKAAAEKYREQITELVNTQLADTQIFVLALSLGGGSGAGSCETLLEILATTGKPICVITVLPMDSEGAQTKSNALQTLSKLSRYAQSKKISNLIVVDNAKIEAVYHNISQIDFFGTANKAIVEPIDIFNTLSSMESKVKPLDPTEFLKLLIDGDGLSVYGIIKVHNYKDEDAIAEAVIENLNSNLLASGFDLKQTKYVGIMVAANEKVWKDISASSINYAQHLVEDQCGTPAETFKGIYTIDTPEDCVMIYSFFSGLGLPNSRVDQLKKEAAQLSTMVKSKDDNRNLTLNLDTGTDQTVSKVQEMKNKIAQKHSAFGKLTSSTVIDRRK